MGLTVLIIFVSYVGISFMIGNIILEIVGKSVMCLWIHIDSYVIYWVEQLVRKKNQTNYLINIIKRSVVTQSIFWKKNIKHYELNLKNSSSKKWSGWNIRLVYNGVIKDFYVGTYRFMGKYDCFSQTTGKITLDLGKYYKNGHLFCDMLDMKKFAYKTYMDSRSWNYVFRLMVISICTLLFTSGLLGSLLCLAVELWFFNLICPS